jgi:hypothetical protein
MFRIFEHLIKALKILADVSTINLFKSYLKADITLDYEINSVVYSENQLDLSGQKSILTLSQVVRMNDTVCERMDKILGRFLPFCSTNKL